MHIYHLQCNQYCTLWSMQIGNHTNRNFGDDSKEEKRAKKKKNMKEYSHSSSAAAAAIESIGNIFNIHSQFTDMSRSSFKQLNDTIHRPDQERFSKLTLRKNIKMQFTYTSLNWVSRKRVFFLWLVQNTNWTT